MTTASPGKAYANALNAARIDAGVSQRMAARQVGIEPRILNAAEHDLATLPPAIIDKLTAFYAQVESPKLIVCRLCGNIAKVGARCVHCGQT